MRYNIIERVAGTTISTIITAAYGEVTLNCNSKFGGTPTSGKAVYCANVQKAGNYNPVGNAVVSEPHIVIKSVKFATTFYSNPLYPNE